MEEIKYDVFISYSRKDYMDKHNNVIPGNEISKILQALTDAGISYWIDKEQIDPGTIFPKKITENIKASRIILFISSHNSNYLSLWTSKEIGTACEWKKCIIPVRIDSSKYSDTIMSLISDLKYIRYHENPEQGRIEMINTIKEKLKVIIEKEKEDREREIEELRSSISQLITECNGLKIKIAQAENEIRQLDLRIYANNQKRAEETKELNSLKNTVPIIPTQKEQIKYDVFISYSRKDYLDEHDNEIPNNEVSKVLQSLINAGINYRIDTRGYNFGKDYINDIKSSRIVLFLSTENSNNNSDWTANEIATACEQEKHIIPLRIDSTKYSDNILFHICDLSYIDYHVNPEQGRVEMINTINNQLNEIKRHEKLAKIIRQEEETKRKEKINTLESSLQKIGPENEQLKNKKSELTASIIDYNNTYNVKAKHHNEQCQQLGRLTNGLIPPLIELINDHEPNPTSPLYDGEFQQFLNKWNWDASVLSIIWCIKNKLYLEALYVYVAFLLMIGLHFIPLPLWIGLKIWLGKCGNNLAWKKNCSKMSPEEFISKQVRWIKWS